MRALEESLWHVPVVSYDQEDIPIEHTFTPDELFENFNKAQALENQDLERLWDLWRKAKEGRARDAVRGIFESDLSRDNKLQLHNTVKWMQTQVANMARAAADLASGTTGR